jgi:hypothetical protein
MACCAGTGGRMCRIFVVGFFFFFLETARLVLVVSIAKAGILNLLCGFLLKMCVGMLVW